jgi:hypothetical protein
MNKLAARSGRCARAHPSALLRPLRRLEADLITCEKRIYDLETSYLDETAGRNVIHGWSSFEKCVISAVVSSLGNPNALSPLTPLALPCRIPLPHKKTHSPINQNDRVFSLSSVSSPLAGAAWPEALRSHLSLATTVTAAAASAGTPTAGGRGTPKKGSHTPR